MEVEFCLQEIEELEDDAGSFLEKRELMNTKSIDDRVRGVVEC